MNKNTWMPTADLLIRNAKIYTVDLSIADIKSGKTDFTVIANGFVAAKDGKTIAVGDVPDERLIGEDTEILDAGGAVLLPGLIDSHMHAMFAGIELLRVNFKDCRSKEALLALLKQRADAMPDGEWILGCEWNELVWDKKEAPTKSDLDRAAPNNPVMCCRLCHHVYAVNSRALALAGITRDTPDPDGGSIGRSGDGEPNGLLYENAAMGLIDAVIPEMTEEETVRAIEGIGKVMNGFGITACIDANMTFEQMRAYPQARAQGRLTYRGNMMFYLDKAWGDVGYHLRRIREMTAVTGFGDDMVKMNGIKVTLDGIPATGTAAMREPYRHMPETSGCTTITEEEMLEVARLGAKYNWQIGVHCCGDRATDVAIKAFAEAYRINPNDARHYIIHCAVYREDQLPLLREHNIPITVQPTIALQMGEQPLIGEELERRYQQLKVFCDAGVLVGGSSDCPVVSCNPFLGMYAAVTRLGADGKLYSPDQALTKEQCIILWTKASAYFCHDDDRSGSIAPGNFADYALIDTDILAASPEEIRDTRVLKTVLGGKLVYEL
ncbi:MAG: amidohydrolase [Clostridiales Family XIII bacterium]|jgi:predicted amidohydrolase YtcJ|nr:amidohydrolase [Clostridiales Family XIII bacterium]